MPLEAAAPFAAVARLESVAQGPALTVEVVTRVARIEELRPDFASLEAAGGALLPFALFEWQLAWLRHFPRHGRNVSDEPLFHVVRRPDGGCVGIIPLILTRRRLGPCEQGSGTDDRRQGDAWPLQVT